MTIAKKTLAVFLAFVILTCNLTTLAQNNFSTETNAAIIQTLQYMEPQKEHYGLADIDFTQLAIGSQLYAYEYSNDSYVPTSYDIYPLLIQNQIVALALIREDETGRKFAQIDTLLANKIADVIQPDEAFFILYDDDSCFYVSQNRIVTLNQDSSKNTSRSNYISLAHQNVSKHNVAYSNIFSTIPLRYQISTVRSINNTIFLPITPQYQPRGSIYCWACCVAVIGNYLTTYNYSAIEIALVNNPLNYNDNANLSEALDILLDKYDVEYRRTDHADYDTISYQLSIGNPLYGRCTKANQNTEHAIVICGENMSTGYLTIMDPDYSYGYIAVYPSYGIYSYIDPLGSTVLTLAEIARFVTYV